MFLQGVEGGEGIARVATMIQWFSVAIDHIFAREEHFLSMNQLTEAARCSTNREIVM